MAEQVELRGTVFSIPMRGNEWRILSLARDSDRVFDPHEG